jgi:hypothetical protein
MPTFQGLVNDEGLNQLIEYVKSLAPKTAGTPAGALVSPSEQNQLAGGEKSQRPQTPQREPYDYRNGRRTTELSEHRLRHQVVAADEGPQADRPALPSDDTLFFAVGGIFATLIRMELLTPPGDMVSSDTYN